MKQTSQIKQAIKQLPFSKMWILGDQVLVSGGNFILGVMLARWLGLSAFGIYSLMWMGVLFTLSIHQAFISQPMMTLYAQKKGDDQPSYLHSILQIQLLLSFAISGLSVLFFFVAKAIGLSFEWLIWLPLVGGVSGLFLLQDTLRKLFFLKQKFHFPFLMDALLYGPLLVGLVLLQLSGNLNLHNALLVMLVVYGASCLAGTLQSDSLSKFHKITIQTTLSEHYHFSIWLLGTSLLQWFSGNFFLIAAAGVMGTVAVGALRMAQNMVGLCHVLFLAMENIVPAEAAQQFFRHGIEKMKAYLQRITWTGGVALLLVLGGLSITAPYLIEILYGAEYVPYSYLVSIFSAHYVLVFLGYPLRYALRTLQFTSPIFVAYCFSASLSLMLAYPMVKSWGIIGVMMGLIGVQGVSLLVYCFFLKKEGVNRAHRPVDIAP